MATQYQEMRKKLGRMQREKQQLEAECRGLARDIGQLTNPLLTELEEMKIPEAAAKMDDLSVKWAEYLVLINKIADLEEELGY